MIVETAFGNGNIRIHELGGLRRSVENPNPESFELLLKDGGALLGQLQRGMLLDQIGEISDTSPICPTAPEPGRFTTIRSLLPLPSTRAFPPL
ncbi:hypothetical protein [Roseobacter weihaiensis]|uniref:hypothetical protein n=1 Tax=Roseobacter weihaiensis TaxID=2763262 RepID=UPI001D0A60B1|nr:hypothetical protein [Roseobacter sp. H9]